MAQLVEATRQDTLQCHPLTETKSNRAQQIMPCSLVFIITLIVFWWNAAPSVTFHDSSEFAIAAASAGIPHPPGAPTWTALASLFVRIGSFSDPARGANLLSGLFGAITLTILFLLVQKWTSKLFPSLSGYISILAGIASVAVMLHSSAFLEQSFITEQYTLLTALVMAMLLISTNILFKSGNTKRTMRLYALLGFFWGLAIGNHLSQVSLVFLVICAVWVGSAPGNRLKCFLYTFTGFAAGLLIFLWLPLRSLSNPLIDWGNIKSWDRFMWAIERKAWHYRPISDAPAGFIREWIRTFAFREQVGVVALMSAIIGFLFTLKKRPVLAGWLAAVAIPYAVGMIAGHMKQQGMDISYIRSYGVVDWHLPLYLVVAVMAGIGVSSVAAVCHKNKLRLALLIVPSCLTAFLLVTSIPVIARSSLRDFKAPGIYLASITARLPKNAIILPTEDNAFGALTYWSYISNPDTDRYVMLRTVSIAKSIDKSAGIQHVWTPSAKYKYLTKYNMRPTEQPFRIPLISYKEVCSSAVFIDFNPRFTDEAKYLLPDGMLFRVVDHQTTNKEVLQSEEAWRQQSPELLRSPGNNAHRLERHAWAVLHRERGAFFSVRQLWNESADSYKRSLEWVPDDGQVWFCMAFALDQAGRTDSAVIAYKQAIDLVPEMKGIRQNLAGLYIRKNNLKEAKGLLEEEVKLDPSNAVVQHNLKAIDALCK